MAQIPGLLPPALISTGMTAPLLTSEPTEYPKFGMAEAIIVAPMFDIPKIFWTCTTVLYKEMLYDGSGDDFEVPYRCLKIHKAPGEYSCRALRHELKPFALLSWPC
jgi:hypothetical protein